MDDKFEQVSISDLIGILIKRKNIIAISIIGFLLLGIFSSFVLSKQMYSSEMSLEINTLEAAPPKSPSIKVTAADSIIESITKANSMDFDSYLSKILSEPVLESTAKDLKLKDKYTSEDLKKIIEINSDSENKRINLRTLLADREEGALILNSLEENFSNYITKLSGESTLKTLDIMEAQMQVEKEKYAESLKEYKKAMNSSSTSKELELELEASYKQLTDYKMSLNDLDIKIASIISALEKSSSNGNTVLRPQPGNVYIGSNRESLIVEQAEIESVFKNTKDKIEDLKEKVQTLQLDYQDAEFAESVIRQRVELTKESYEIFSQKYEELKMESSIDLGGISINKLSSPSPTGKPVGTRKAIKLVIFLVLGIVTGILLAFLSEYLDVLKSKRKIDK